MMSWFNTLKNSILKWTKAQRILALGSVLIVAMALAAVFSEKGFMNVYDFTEELDYLKKSNAVLAEENVHIQKEIDALKSDPYAVEMLARDKLNLVKPGETVYQIVRETQSPEKAR
jgi:cell division protein FtsB